MSQLLHIDAEYKKWIQELSLRYRQSQIKASIRVNSEMLRFYWSIGKDIAEKQFDNKYGMHFYENLSRDLVAALNVKKGFSPTNLKYTKYFYNLYSPLSENRRQVADELVNANRQQPADDFELLFCIPWTHHQKIIDKVQGDSQKALFFVRKTWENQWGRGMLVNFLDTDLYEREGKALSNFSMLLPEVESDFAQQLIKDPYHFEFLQLNEKYSETELKDELMNKLSQFLLELGKGFCFEARQKRMIIDDEYYFADLVFYNRILHCNVIIELKDDEFKHADLSQLNAYVSYYCANEMNEGDNPPIGILLCTRKGEKMVEYALAGMDNNLFVSTYMLALPDKETLREFILSELK